MVQICICFTGNYNLNLRHFKPFFLSQGVARNMFVKKILSQKLLSIYIHFRYNI